MIIEKENELHCHARANVPSYIGDGECDANFEVICADQIETLELTDDPS